MPETKNTDDTKGPSRTDGQNNRRDIEDDLQVAALNAAEEGLNDKPEQPEDLPEAEWHFGPYSDDGTKKYYKKYDDFR